MGIYSDDDGFSAAGPVAVNTGVMRLTGLGLFGATGILGLLAGLGAWSVVKACLILALQIVAGLYLLRRSQLVLNSVLEISLAAVIGSVLVGLWALLRGSVDALHGVPPVAGSGVIGLLGAFCLLRQSKNSSIATDLTTRADVLGPLSSALILLSQGWGWLVPSAWVFFGVAVSLRWFKPAWTRYVAGLVLIGSVIVGFIFAGHLRTEQWWGLRFGFLPDPDVQFVESSANSVGLFGWSDNIFFRGFRYGYHVFSFAWINGSSEGLGLSPFEFSAVIAHIYLAILFPMLVFGILIQLGKSAKTAWLVIIVLSALWADPIPLLQIWNPFSLSHNYSLVIVISIVAMLAIATAKRNWLLIALLSIAAVLSKASTLVTIELLLIGSTLYRQSLLNKSRSPLALPLGTASLVAVVFLVHYQPFGVLKDSSNVVSPTVDLGGILGSRGFGPPTGSALTSIVVLIVFGLFIHVCFYIPRRERDDENRNAFILKILSLSSLGTLVSGIGISDESQSSNYYISTALGLLVLGVGIRVPNTSFNDLRSAPSKYFMVFVVGISVMTMIHFMRRDSIIFVAFLFTVASTLLIVSRIVVTLNRPVVQLLILVFIAVFTLAIPASRRIADSVAAKDHVLSDYEYPGGGSDLRDLLLWVRNHTARDAVVLNSRLCNFGYDRINNGRINEYNFGAKCYRGWSLTSALTARSNFFEGHYPLVPLIPNEVRAERYALADAFFSNPNADSAAALIEAGVDFVIMEAEMTGMSEVATFPGVVFRSAGGYIIQLNDPARP